MPVNPLILSGSSLNVFMECPKQWEYLYLWRRDMPPSYKMALGVAAHEAVDFGLKHKLRTGRLPLVEAWTAVFDAEWEKAAADSRPKNHQPAESAEAHKASGRSAVGFYARQVAPDIDVVAVEKPFAITINDHVWTGTIDLIDRMPDGRLRLRDHKFTSKRPDSPERYRRSMLGYYLAATQLFGEIAEIRLDYIIRGSPNTYMPLLLRPDEREILAFATEIEEAVTMIDTGRFPPLGNQTLACRWCPYRKVCRYVRS